MWLVAMTFLLAGGRVHAAPSDAEISRKLYDRALVAEAGKNWREAIALLEQAAESKPTSSVRLHLAKCHSELGELVAAVVAYDSALELMARERASDRPAWERRIALFRQRVPSVTLGVENLSSLRGTIDGKPVLVVSGLPISVDPGAHRLRVEADGRRAWAADVTLAEAQSLELTVTLPLEIATQAGPVRVAERPADPKQRSSSATWRLFVVGTEGLTAAVGAALLIQGRVAADRADDRVRDYQSRLTPEACAMAVPPTFCSELPEALEDRDAANARAVVGGALLIAGGIAGIATWLLWSTEGSSTHIIDKVSVAPSPGGAALRVGFQ